MIPSRFITYGGILYRITVQAKINGRGLDFLLDSGSDRMTIDPGVAHELGMTPFGRAEHMSMGALNMDADVLSTTPYTEDPDGKSPIVGLMGFPFSASGIVGIDFKAQTVTIYPRSTFDPKALGLVALPISFDDDLPRFLTNVEGVQGQFLVDTGSERIVLQKPFAQRLPTVFDFAGTRFKNVSAYENLSSTFESPGEAGMIGLDLMANYRVYFDYADGAILVKPVF